MLERRHTLLRAAACLLAAIALVAPAVRAQVPPVMLNPDFGYPFPGDFTSPANAASAGVALADRWLGISAYENPAANVPRGIEVSPMFQRVNRQDMAAQNRDYDQVVGYPAFGGARLSVPVAGWGLTAYAWQPVLRLEEYSFSAGPLATPAFVRLLTAQQELRAGLAVSRAFGNIRLGVAGEWVNRDDQYESSEQSGAPTAGDRVIQMSGSGVGGSAGISYEKDADKPWGSWFGAAVHYSPELTLDGTADEQLALGSSTSAFTLTRAAEWSGGASGKVAIAPSTRFVAGLSYRSGADYGATAPSTSSGFAWGAGIDWKDDELPWGARFGVGQESLPDAAEPKAGLISIGFAWISGDLGIDISLLHRNMSREDLPHSSDDRAVLSVKVGF